MQAFSKGTRQSAEYARNRMKLLLISEHVNCSPQMMKLLRKDITNVLKKYLNVEEQQVKIKITQDPPTFHVVIPVRKNKE